MNARCMYSLFAVVGALVPILWLFVDLTLLRDDSNLTSFIMGTLRFDLVLLAIWPSWLILVADPEGRSIALAAISVGVNVLLYGVIGYLVWLGLYRSRLILFVVITTVGYGWYFVLNWYLGW